MISENKKRIFTFPRNFLFGAATSAHQIEGNLKNDWSLWEQASAERLAKEAHSKWSLRLQKKFPEMFSRANYISGKACDHYNRFEEDLDIAKELSLQSFRFSIEWARIEPQEGVFDEKEIEHYKKVIDATRKRGIEPFVTLWHWPLPLWLSEKGGWEYKGVPELFARYAEKLATSFGSSVLFYTTLNEPEIWSGHAYMTGQWPPQKKNPFLYYQVLEHLISGHKKAYVAIKKISPHARIGISKHNIYFETKRDTFINRILKKVAHYVWNERFLNRIDDFQDYIGLNFYKRNVIDNGFGKNDGTQRSDMDWELHPESLEGILVDLKKYKKPIYITECGLADKDDTQRVWYIEGLIRATARAMEKGVDVRGFAYWSLLDNFEWDKGFWPRFGLVDVNYATLKRTVRESANAYKEIIQSRTIYL